MKPSILFLSLLFLSSGFRAQTPAIIEEVKTRLLAQHPELDVEEKLVAINIWSSSDKNSRECNKAFEQVCSTYAYARLEGGRRGVLLVLLNKENLDEMALLAVGKDGLVCSYSLKASDIASVSDLPKKNIVYNSKGETVYTNLSTDQVFTSFQSLITR